MSPFLLIGSFIGAASSLQAGAAARRAGEAQALQYKQEKRQNEIETLQRHNDRLASYDAARASNLAWFSFAGRDITDDRSIKAFLDKQREVAFTDVARSDTQGYAEGAQLALQAQTARARGRSAQQAATIKAFSTISSGLYNYSTVKV